MAVEAAPDFAKGLYREEGGNPGAPEITSELCRMMYGRAVFLFFSEIFRARYQREAGMPAVTAGVFRYINEFYNPRRRHSYFGNTSPVKYLKYGDLREKVTLQSCGAGS